MNYSGLTRLHVSGPAHAGGTVKTEPFHITVEFENKQGQLIEATLPDGSKSTRHHVYVSAKDGADLKAKAKAHKAAKGPAVV